MGKRRVTREDVLGAAAEIVRKYGAEGLNARAVAGELGCSTQPVYSTFAGMDGLKAALRQRAGQMYRESVAAYQTSGEYSGYQSFGMGFVRFAREERGLFRFLFLTPEEGAEPFLGEIVAEMTAHYGMDEARARLFHRDMGVYSFGLAVAACFGAAAEDEEVGNALKREFYALQRYYFPERAAPCGEEA